MSPTVAEILAWKPLIVPRRRTCKAVFSKYRGDPKAHPVLVFLKDKSEGVTAAEIRTAMKYGKAGAAKYAHFHPELVEIRYERRVAMDGRKRRVAVYRVRSGT